MGGALDGALPKAPSVDSLVMPGGDWRHQAAARAGSPDARGPKKGWVLGIDGELSKRGRGPGGCVAGRSRAASLTFGCVVRAAGLGAGGIADRRFSAPLKAAA